MLQANGGTIERLERDVDALTDEQRLSAVMADAPELAALLGELQSSLAEVRSHVGPVLKEVTNLYLVLLDEAFTYLQPCNAVLRQCLVENDMLGSNNKSSHLYSCKVVLVQAARYVTASCLCQHDTCCCTCADAAAIAPCFPALPLCADLGAHAELVHDRAGHSQGCALEPVGTAHQSDNA